MAQSKSTKTDEFDSIVIGAGLAGLIVANQLEATGRRVALVEGLDTVGGSCRPAPTKAGVIDHGFKFFPESAQNADTLAWLSSVLGEPLELTPVDAPPVTYDEGKFKPFVGFGDQKVNSAAEVDGYAKAQFYRLSKTPKDWVPRLTESFTGTLLTQSFATKLQVDDEFVIEVLLNGSKRISGREVFFCALPQQLVRLLPETHLPARLRQKLMKGEFWTSINLNLVHGTPVTESEAVHVLKGANEEPSFGAFLPPTTVKNEDGTTSTYQMSQWTTLVPRDITDEPELVASALKQIKRQVKRAYETSLDSIVTERIVVSPTSHGDLVGALPADGRWPKLQNLWVVSSFLDEAKNTLGAIGQARRVLASIVGEPIETVEHSVDISSDVPHATT
jgi:hypothetical protein